MLTEPFSVFLGEEFAEPVLFVLASGERLELRGIYDREFLSLMAERLEPQPIGGAEGQLKTVYVLSTLIAELRHYDLCQVRGEWYLVRGIAPDGDAFSTVALEWTEAPDAP
ncbi:MAG: hypothetical protein DDT26_00099 [Dehalococcoidia bacterium]|nr:hypothetical protein [Chloroflexota bacterium]